MTILNRVAIRCVNNSEHQMFRETDGARCVECKGIMNPIPVTEAQYCSLPSYNEWNKQRAQEPKRLSTIAIEMEHPDKPPKVIVEGKEVKVISLRYNYDTKKGKHSGQHNYTIEYYCDETDTHRKLEVGRVFEDKQRHSSIIVEVDCCLKDTKRIASDMLMALNESREGRGR